MIEVEILEACINHVIEGLYTEISKPLKDLRDEIIKIEERGGNCYELKLLFLKLLLDFAPDNLSELILYRAYYEMVKVHNSRTLNKVFLPIKHTGVKVNSWC